MSLDELLASALGIVSDGDDVALDVVEHALLLGDDRAEVTEDLVELEDPALDLADLAFALLDELLLVLELAIWDEILLLLLEKLLVLAVGDRLD